MSEERTLKPVVQRPALVLETTNLLDYLAERKVKVEHGSAVSVLAGGVSSNAFLVDAGPESLVVKQLLGRLRVDAAWVADPSRVLVEAIALRRVAQIDSTYVPRVVDVDVDNFVLVMEAIDDTWVPWKVRLLEGRVEMEVASRLGQVAGEIHSDTARNSVDQSTFDDLRHFEELRIDPFYREVARRHPTIVPRVNELASWLLEGRRCLVHGDLSPKNVLTDGVGAVVIDWEIAHFGEPLFDLAFLLSHLRCKAIRSPAHRPSLRACATAFLEAHRSATQAGGLDVPFTDVVGHIGVLVLARIDGKSPVDYLSNDQRDACRRWAMSAILGGGDDPDAIWDLE